MVRRIGFVQREQGSFGLKRQKKSPHRSGAYMQEAGSKGSVLFKQCALNLIDGVMERGF